MSSVALQREYGTTLVALDPQGVWGPAIPLIYNPDCYSAKGILELAELLKTNFMKLAHVKPKGKKEFCAFVQEKSLAEIPITPTDIVNTKFFQTMQQSPLPPYHGKVLESIVPPLLKRFREQIPQSDIENEDTQKVNEWAARCVECYMTEQQITQYCELAVTENIAGERQSIGQELYNDKQLTEKDFDSIIEASRIALDLLKITENPNQTLKLTGRYLILFSMDKKNPEALAKDVLDKLGILRTKKFTVIK